MKNFLKYAAVGVAGYLIGFYEFKYKVVKAMASVSMKGRSSNKGSFLLYLTKKMRSDPT